jgi:hypothetical protein
MAFWNTYTRTDQARLTDLEKAVAVLQLKIKQLEARK